MERIIKSSGGKSISAEQKKATHREYRDAVSCGDSVKRFTGTANWEKTKETIYRKEK